MRKETERPRREFLATAAGMIAIATSGATMQSAFSEDPLWQIGCYTRPWAAYDYRVALDAIAEAGFKYAGLMTTNSPNRLVLSVATTQDEASAIREETRKRGLITPSAYGGDIPVTESLEAGIAGMHTLIDNCVAAGVTNLMMGGVGTAELAQVYYKAIAEACPYAAERGIAVSVKPHGGTNATGPELRKIIESMNHPSFRVWYDPGNVFYYSDGKLDPVDDAGTVDGLVVGMSVKDYRDPKIVDLTPGTGRVDFVNVMKRLKQGGFTSGPLIIECLAPGELPQLRVEASKAREFVESLVQAL